MLKQDTELRPDFTPPLCKIIVLIFYKQGRNLKMKDEKKTLSTPGKFAGVLQRGIAGFRAGDSASLCRIRNSAVLFVLSFVLSAAELSPGVYPFGTAVLCAVNGSVSAAVTFSGAVLGTLGMQSGALWQILVLSAAFIARVCAGAAEGAFSKKKNAPMARLFHEAGYVRVTICAAAAAGAGIVTIVSSTGLYSAVFSALLGLLTYQPRPNLLSPELRPDIEALHLAVFPIYFSQADAARRHTVPTGQIQPSVRRPVFRLQMGGLLLIVLGI